MSMVEPSTVYGVESVGGWLPLSGLQPTVSTEDPSASIARVITGVAGTGSPARVTSVQVPTSALASAELDAPGVGAFSDAAGEAGAGLADAAGLAPGSLWSTGGTSETVIAR